MNERMTNKRRTMNEQKTNKRRTMNEQKTVRAARADKQMTKERRTNDEGRVVLNQREVKAKRVLKKRILVDFNFGKVQDENSQTNSGRLQKQRTK